MSLLSKVAVPKKSLLMFRAITDTASDGQLSILSNVGINIELMNPNLTFLLRRIRNTSGVATNSTPLLSNSGSNSSSISVSPVKHEQVEMKGLLGTSKAKSSATTMQSLAKGITISKVSSPSKGTGRPGRPPGSSSIVGYNKPGPKPKNRESSTGTRESNITSFPPRHQTASTSRAKGVNFGNSRIGIKAKIDLLLSKV